MAINWSELGAGAAEILAQEFGQLVADGGREVRERLLALGHDMARYWQRAEAGDVLAGKDLLFLRSTARLLVARYQLKASSAAQRSAEQVVDILARLGVQVLKSLVKP